MNLRIIDFQTAKDLKELGFDWRVECAYLYDGGELFGNKEECVAYLYNQNHNGKEHRFSAPTQPEVCKWLRDVKNIDISVYRTAEDKQGNKYGCEGENWSAETEAQFNLFNVYDKTYEEVERAGIKKAIKLLKDKKL